MTRLALAAAALAILASPALAVRPTSESRADARRFGLDRFEKVHRRAPAAETRAAFKRFDSSEGGGWKVRYDPRTGLPAAVTGGRSAPRRGRPDEAARAFLNSRGAMLGIEPSVLKEGRQSHGKGHHHLLYRQTYHGIPVEFASVKVHLDEQGAVIGADSTFEPGLSLPTTPAVDAAAAARAALADARTGAAEGPATLVILPLETTGRVHLAWKVRVRTVSAAWRYYVDAMTGQVLFRYNNLRFFTQGTVDALVYDIDPDSTPGPVGRHVAHQYVHVGSNAQRTETDRQGNFLSNPSSGKVVMSLQGPFVNVAEFRGASMLYNNGAGVWNTLSTPASSPHPYPNSSIIVSTIDISIPAPGAVAFLPIFTNFKVGGFSGLNASDVAGGDITDDDQVKIYNRYDEPVASYIGDFASLAGRLPFHTAVVHGKKLHIALKSNESGTNDGYDVAVSSYLTLTNADTDARADPQPLNHSSHTWTAADSINGTQSEIALFYHLNKMHDYFLDDINKSSAAPVNGPVVAMVHVGPTLRNAFYNPDHDNLFFGDVSNDSISDAFTLDATVSHHEYVHYLIEKIWSIQNFGQAGAISEGLADYFAASSLDHSAIGTYVLSALGEHGSLRELDCVGNPPCKVLTSGSWSGEIHDDSPFFSQALWDIRRDRMLPGNLGAAAGKSCADGLVFQALLFFPESFKEFQDAMLEVDRRGWVASCGAANVNTPIITASFNAHGLNFGDADGFEPNDGFETAVDITTMTTVSASLYPVSDADFWSFGAGAGLVELTLSLPADPSHPGYYKAYQIKLFDRSRRQVAVGAPPYDGFGTINSYCDNTECTTTAAQVVLRYNNPTGGLLYAEVVGGDSWQGSASGVNSTSLYTLKAAYPRSGALSGSIVTATYDNDTIAFSVDVSTFISNQDWRFDHAQLRNQSFWAMPNTVTNTPPLTGDYLTLLSSANAGGFITGSVKLAPGFARRFPSVGTVYLEVFGYNVNSSTSSLGLSNALNLTDNQTSLDAYNNLFNPLKGEKTTVKYAVTQPGHLSLKLYTATGRFILTLFDDNVPAGRGSVDWDGRNLTGATVASGVYVVRAQGPGLDKTQKIVLVK